MKQKHLQVGFESLIESKSLSKTDSKDGKDGKEGKDDGCSSYWLACPYPWPESLTHRRPEDTSEFLNPETKITCQ